VVDGSSGVTVIGSGVVGGTIGGSGGPHAPPANSNILTNSMPIILFISLHLLYLKVFGCHLTLSIVPPPSAVIDINVISNPK
jgi:hypothetical protein